MEIRVRAADLKSGGALRLLLKLEAGTKVRAADLPSKVCRFWAGPPEQAWACRSDTCHSLETVLNGMFSGSKVRNDERLEWIKAFLFEVKEVRAGILRHLVPRVLRCVFERTVPFKGFGRLMKQWYLLKGHLFALVPRITPDLKAFLSCQRSHPVQCAVKQDSDSPSREFPFRQVVNAEQLFVMECLGTVFGRSGHR
jgi:hypothetical protein